MVRFIPLKVAAFTSNQYVGSNVADSTAVDLAVILVGDKDWTGDTVYVPMPPVPVKKPVIVVSAITPVPVSIISVTRGGLPFGILVTDITELDIDAVITIVGLLAVHTLLS
jgi:hypothetical protein